MNIRKSYWILSLSLLLSFSVALPHCFYADISQLFSHHHEMPSHTSHGQDSGSQQCNCGHELAKAYQKVKKVDAGQNTLLLAGLSSEEFPILDSCQSASTLAAMQPGILNDSGPPLHLMNSVFLN